MLLVKYNGAVPADSFVLTAFLQESGNRSCLNFMGDSVKEFYYSWVGYGRRLGIWLLCRDVRMLADRHVFHKRGATVVVS